MMNFRKRLCIEVEDVQEQNNEEETLFCSLQRECKGVKFPDSFSGMKPYEEEKQKIHEIDNPFVNQLISYMEGENTNSDLSYSWLSRIHNVSVLARSLHVSLKSMDKILSQRDLNCEFKLLKLITEDVKHKENLLKLKRSLNRNNRYTDIIPYGYNAALIGEENSCTGSPTSNSVNCKESSLEELYINASYIDGPLQEDSKYFIATQGPMNNTIAKFWKLVFTKNVKLITMLCTLEEDFRKKCECYWPPRGTVKNYDGEIEVCLEKEENLINKSLIKREFIIRYNNMEKRVVQLQMLNWPDHSVPEEDAGYNTLEFLNSAVNESKVNFPGSPVLVHCSAGTGRTGTFIAIHNIIRSLQVIKYINQGVDQFHKIKPFFSVFNLVRKLREQRMFMITSQAQYRFIYDFALEWIKRNFEPMEN